MLLNECKYITTSLQDRGQFIQIYLKFIHYIFAIEKQAFITYNYKIHLP